MKPTLRFYRPQKQLRKEKWKLETPETRETSFMLFSDTDVRTTILKQYVFFINLIRLRNVYSFIEIISLLKENGKCVFIDASSFTNSLSFYTCY
jgi:hypothetical protein